MSYKEDYMSRKLEILTTALKLFNTTNTQTATTNHIAKEMGISPGNLHYHYKNREEIILYLYKQMREKMTLSIEELPKTIKELNEHQKVLMKVQWEYRFFFKEILFLFSRDKELERLYIEDNIAHRSRIKISLGVFMSSGELNIKDEETLEYLVDAVLMSWQFYISYLQTLGKGLDSECSSGAIKYVNDAMKPYTTQGESDARA